jgi:hypothetical protein
MASLHSSTLRRTIVEAKKATGFSMADLTVLSKARDPYRLDTPANHRDAEWLGEAFEKVRPDNGKPIHLRALHYRLTGRVLRLDGKPYQNDDPTWVWVSEKAAKYARYLGYIPWNAIKDARNSRPVIFRPDYEPPCFVLSVGGAELILPEPLVPEWRLRGDFIRQPYQQIVISEKQSVEDLLRPVCARYGAVLAMPSGEISGTMAYELLRDAAEDGRPLIIHQLADNDPSGVQMAVSTSRTVQAIIQTQFPELEVAVYAPLLTVRQCEDWNLPSSPLKEEEKRADTWKEQTGREQTELDAALAEVPDELVSVVEESLGRFFDPSVDRRQYEQRREQEARFNAMLADSLGSDALESLRARAEAKIAELQAEIDALNAHLSVDASILGIDTPPAPDITYGATCSGTKPLFSTAMSFVTATRTLIARKKFEVVS